MRSPTENLQLAATGIALMGAAANSAALSASELNSALASAPRRKGSKRRRARQQTPEELYAPLIKLGKVRVVRRKGQPPLIQWL